MKDKDSNLRCEEKRDYYKKICGGHSNIRMYNEQSKKFTKKLNLFENDLEFSLFKGAKVELSCGCP